MKILMVDDHALIRDALRRVLKQVRRGAAVVEASTGLEALEIMASQSDVDLVLLEG